MSNNCSISRIERSSEVIIPENAFSMFGSHAPQNDDHDFPHYRIATINGSRQINQ